MNRKEIMTELHTFLHFFAKARPSLYKCNEKKEFFKAKIESHQTASSSNNNLAKNMLLTHYTYTVQYEI